MRGNLTAGKPDTRCAGFRPTLRSCASIAFLTLVLLSACSSSSPELIQLRFQLNALDDRVLGLKYEKLSVFAHVEDGDGIEDLEEILIIHDESGLLWSYTSDTWELSLRGEETWIGSNGIIMNDYSSLPPGEYRVELIDLAGFRTEASFTLAPHTLPLNRITFPEARLQDETIMITSRLPVTAFVYTSEGRFVHTAPLTQGSNRKSVILGRLRPPGGGEIDRIYLYAYEPEEGYGILSGPFFMNGSPVESPD